MCKDLTKIVQILYKFCANIAQIFGKYWANIGQILRKYWANITQILGKYCRNIIQIFFGSNRAMKEQTRLNRAKCDLISFSVKFHFIELLTQLKILFLTIFFDQHFLTTFSTTKIV